MIHLLEIVASIGLVTVVVCVVLGAIGERVMGIRREGDEDAEYLYDKEKR